MACVHVLGTVQLFKPWNQIAYQYLQFLFYVDFSHGTCFLPQVLKNQLHKGIIKGMQCILMWKQFELAVQRVSDICKVLL